MTTLIERFIDQEDGYNASERSTYSTYHMYPTPGEQKMGKTQFYTRTHTSFLDYLNLLFYAGGACLFFIYFIDSFDSFGYIMFVVGIIIVCEILVV